MSEQPNYITPAGFQKLQEEFRKLFHDERPKLVEVITWAAGNGDRSENGDYIYGKRRLREIDKRLKYLRDRIESAMVVDPQKMQTTKIQFGATVFLEDEDGKPHAYKIVGEDEIAPGENAISWKSPVAKALLGRVAGDEVEVKRPAGTTHFTIVDVKYV